MEISCEKIKEFHEDEKKGKLAYREVGEGKLARDEAGHENYWKHKWAKNKCEGKLE